MKIQTIQYSPDWENFNSNISRLYKLLIQNKSEADLIIFPEMTLTGFTMNSTENVISESDESFLFFENLAIESNSNVFAGMIEKENNEIFNTLVHFNSNGKVEARYKKIHPFSLSGEDKNYSAGNETVITKIGKYKIGLSVCYDLRFPQLYRNYAKERVDLIVDIANWPVKRISHWRSLIIARAIENQCFFVGVNRTGNDPVHTYPGNSMIVSPMGEVIYEAGPEESAVVTEINIDEAAEIKKNLPFLDDMKL